MIKIWYQVTQCNKSAEPNVETPGLRGGQDGHKELEFIRRQQMIKKVLL